MRFYEAVNLVVFIKYNGKGDVHVYEDYDNQREQVHLMLKDFTYSYCITDIDKVAKITLN